MWKALVDVLRHDDGQHPHLRQALAASAPSIGDIGQATFRSALNSTARRLPFDVLLLNLEKSKERLRRMSQMLAAANIGPLAWRRVPGVYGSDLDLGSLQLTGFVTSQQQHSRNNVACAWSHYVLWAAIAAHSSPSNRSVLVLEDDAILKSGFVQKTIATLRRCERLRYDICSLTWYRHMTPEHCRVPLQPTEPHGGPSYPPLVRLGCKGGGLVTGTAAYLISPRGARRALTAGLPYYKEIDKQLGHTEVFGQNDTLRWFGLERESEVASHNFSVRSVRVHGQDRRLSISR